MQLHHTPEHSRPPLTLLGYKAEATGLRNELKAHEDIEGSVGDSI